MTRRPTTSPTAAVVGTLLVVTVVVLVLKWLAITAAILAVPFAIWWILDRAQQPRPASVPAAPRTAAPTLARPVTSAQRARIEARAVLDAAGQCGWCGAPAAHRDPRTGRRVAPRDYHRNDIEQAVVLAEAHRAASAGGPLRPAPTRVHRVG